MRQGGAEEPPEGERSRRGARPPTSPLGKSSPPKPPGESAFSSVCSGLDCFQPSGRGGVRGLGAFAAECQSVGGRGGSRDRPPGRGPVRTGVPAGYRDFTVPLEPDRFPLTVSEDGRIGQGDGFEN